MSFGILRVPCLNGGTFLPGLLGGWHGMGWSGQPGQWRGVESAFLDEKFPSFPLSVGISPLQRLSSRPDGSLARVV